MFDLSAECGAPSFDQTLLGSRGGSVDCYGALAVSEDTDRLFAIDFCSDTVDVYDTKTLNLLGSVPVPRAGTTPLMVSVGQLGQLPSTCDVAEALKLRALGVLAAPDPDSASALSALQQAIAIEEELRASVGTTLQLNSAGFWLWRASLLERIAVKQLQWMGMFDSPRIRELFIASARRVIEVSLSNLRSGCGRL